MLQCGGVSYVKVAIDCVVISNWIPVSLVGSLYGVALGCWGELGFIRHTSGSII